MPHTQLFRGRFVFFFVALALVSTFVVAPSATASKANSIVLKGKNVINTDRSVAFDVSLSKDTHMEFSCVGNPHMFVVGAGRVTGVMLISKSSSAPVGVWETQWRSCPKPGCGSAYPNIDTSGTEGCGPNATEQEAGADPNVDYDLPAGDYQLLVVADAAPVTATVTFDALKGSQRLHNGESVPSRISLPEFTASDPAGKTFTGSAPDVDMPSGGLMFEATEWGDEVASAAPAGTCYSRSEATQPGPECSATRELGADDGHTAVTAYASRITDYLVDAGTWHSSYWMVRNDPEDLSIMNLWVPFPH